MADTFGMPKKRIVLVLSDLDAERIAVNAMVRGVTVERFVRDAIEHLIRCRGTKT